MDTHGYHEQKNQLYAQNVKAHTGIKRGETMLQINYNIITVQDAVYLLSNNKGYMDADKQCLIVE